MPAVRPKGYDKRKLIKYSNNVEVELEGEDMIGNEAKTKKSAKM